MCRVWWKRGQRPPGLCDKRFTFAYIFAVVEPGTDNAFALVLPYANTEAMQEFLDRFAATIGEDERIANNTIYMGQAEDTRNDLHNWVQGTDPRGGNLPGDSLVRNG